MDIRLSNNQIKQISSSLSINDVLNCIYSNYDDYIKFLEKELEDNKISRNDFEEEIKTIKKLGTKKRMEMTTI